jgi:Cys-tRNA(Pro)/Cys-tRNA(Cys) deacylase
MPITNNFTRLLDSKHIAYTAFELPEEKLGAVETAEFLGVPTEIVFKTIVVVHPPRKPLLCVVPGDSVVDLKTVAALCGEKKVAIPTQNEAEHLTGLQAGGISPLALINKGFTTYIDSRAQDFSEIHISGGQRGLNLKIRPADLAKLANARFAVLSKPAEA